MRRVLMALLAAVVVAAVVAAGLLWWLGRTGSALEGAVALAPADSERLTWTDWAGVRAELGADLDDASGAGALRAFLDEGFERDLTSTSALVQSAPALQREYGFSPATVDWELFSQSTAGAVVIIGLGEEADTAVIADRLAGLGYAEPDEEGGIWRGGADTLARIDPSLTPELQYVVMDADESVLYSSDNAAHLADVTSGDDLGPASVVPAVEASGDALTAAVYTGSYACSALAMGSADADDQAEADRLLAEAGEVNPVTGFAMSAQPDGQVRVVLSFENDEQARTNADTRAMLAGGPAPGQGGDFGDRFEVDAVTAQGSTVTMDLDPVEGQYVISDLSNGPVLFATC